VALTTYPSASVGLGIIQLTVIVVAVLLTIVTEDGVDDGTLTIKVDSLFTSYDCT
jgi:hypothetical protein